MDPVMILAAIFIFAFMCEFIDSTLGMGYGTTLTPVLLLMGYQPLAVVPAILLSEFVTGGAAAFMHHRMGNVRFDFRNSPEHRIVRKMGKLGYIPRSRDSRIALVLGVCSLLGSVVAVVVAFNIPKTFLKLFISVIVLSMGILILIKRNSIPRFSWKRIVGLGVVAAFNKGLSGGGYGPLVTSGQILSGVNSKNSVAITSLAESFTCLVGVATYIILGASVDWTIAPVLIGGAILSVPFSAWTVKRMRINRFTTIVGAATLALGLLSVWKVLF